jgi:hypothetical protein
MGEPKPPTLAELGLPPAMAHAVRLAVLRELYEYDERRPVRNPDGWAAVFAYEDEVKLASVEGEPVATVEELVRAYVRVVLARWYDAPPSDGPDWSRLKGEVSERIDALAAIHDKIDAPPEWRAKLWNHLALPNLRLLAEFCTNITFTEAACGGDSSAATVSARREGAAAWLSDVAEAQKT